jgi:hypothetical protein
MHRGQDTKLLLAVSNSHCTACSLGTVTKQTYYPSCRAPQLAGERTAAPPCLRLAYLHASYPADSWQVVVHEQVVRLVIKPPLAHHKPCPAVLALLHHVGEVLLLLQAPR